MWQIVGEAGDNQMKLKFSDVGKLSCALKAEFTPYCPDSALFDVPEDLSVTSQGNHI